MNICGTALALLFTKHGFVFAADGLELRADGKPVSTKSKKIFQLGEALAFSCAGFRGVLNEDTGKARFELPTAFKETFDQSAKAFPNDFRSLTDATAQGVRIKLTQLKEKMGMDK